MKTFTPELTVKVNSHSSATANGSLQLFLRQLRLVAILFAMAFPAGLWAQAPTIIYAGPQSYTKGTAIAALTPSNTGGAVGTPAYGTNPFVGIGSGITNPTVMVTDGSGNIYVTDGNAVKKMPAGGGAAVTINSTFSSPYGLCLDAAGDIYVADKGNNAIKEIPLVSGTYMNPVTLGSGFKAPQAVAVDAAGDVYVGDTGNGSLKEIPASSPGSILLISTNYSAINGLAVDGSGNLYLGDYNNGAVYKFPAGGGSAVTIGSGYINGPTGFSVDAAGNVYVAASGNLYEIHAGGGQVTLGTSNNNVSGTPFNNIRCAAPDGAGNVYIADGNTSLKELKPTGGYYIGPFLPAGLSFNNTTGAISGTPTAGSPATNYTATAYNSAGLNSATVNITVNAPAPFSPPTIIYAGPQSYTKGTAIAALTPSNTGGAVGTPAYGTNPFVGIGSGITNPTVMVTDGSGNIYVTDGNAVKKMPAGGGAAVTINSTFSSPYGLCLDAAGDIYVADKGNNAIKEIPLVSGTYMNPVTLGSGFKAPQAVAVDAAGDVYVGDTGNGSLKEIPASSPGSILLISTNYSAINGLAVDGSGNLYLGDYNNGAVYKFPAGGGSAVTIGSGYINGPTGFSVDAAGNVYVAASGNLYEIHAGGGQVTLGTSNNNVSGTPFNNIRCAAPDGAGNVYIADGNTSLKELKPTGGYYIGPFLPAGLSFNNTTGAISGTPTAGSPATNYTATAYNSAGLNSATVNITVNAPAPFSPPTIIYAGPQSYTKGTAIAALTPSNTGGAVGTPAYGTNPFVGIGSGITNPTVMVTDGSGNIYVTDGNAVKKMPAGGGAAVTINSTFSSPYGLCLDAAGDIYVADKGNNAIKEIPLVSGTYMNPVTLGSGFKAPQAVAVDAAGDVYVGDTGNGSLKEIPASSPGSILLISTNYSAINGLAVDGSGNLYLGDYNNGAVYKFPAGGGSAVTIGSGYINGPTGFSVDAAGNVYVAASGNLYEIHAGGGQVTLGTSNNNVSGTPFNNIRCAAPDGAGNVYIADGNTSLKELKPTGGYYIGPFLPAGLSFNNTTGAISGTPTAITTPTNYTITGYNSAGSNAANVNIVVGVLTFTSIPSMPYGSADFSPGATSTHSITYTSSNTSVATIVSGDIHITGAGSSTITANDGFTSLTQTLTVTPVPLTITVNNKSKVYGAPYPTFTFSYAGLVNGDAPVSLTTPPIAITAPASSPVGTYPITASGAVDNNYVISYVSGSLTITKAALTISAASQVKTYGAALPVLAVNYSGLVNGDTPSNLTTQPTVNTAATATSPAGSYPITVSGAVDANYNISYVAGSLTVNQAILTVTANNKNKVYNTANPPLTVTYSGFANGDSQASLSTKATVITTATTASPVGNYPITASGAADPNYTISYVAGTLTVTQASLTITANNVNKTYGTALTGAVGSTAFSATGLQNSETIGSVTIAYGAGSATTAAVGTYTGSVTPSSAAGGTFTASNYTITYATGNIIVGTAPLTITANNVNKAYGATLSGASGSTAFTSIGLQNSDAVGSVTIAYGLGSASTAALGTYNGSVTPSTAAGGTFTASNYTITYASGNINVGKASLTITANNVNKTYGKLLTGAAGSTAFSATGLQNSETIGTVTIAYSAGSATTAAVGTYNVSVIPSAATGGTFTAGNYNITYAKGNIIVNKASLTITANNVIKPYGTTLTGGVGSGSFAATGAQNSETVGGVTIAYGTGSAANAAVGTYTGSVSPSSATGGTFIASNYTITYIAGNIIVGTVPLTITAGNVNKNYGTLLTGAAGSTAFTPAGLQNSETIGSVTIAYGTGAAANAAAGAYTGSVTPSSATGGTFITSNYTITYVAANIIVGKAPLTITANNVSKTYGTLLTGAAGSTAFTSTALQNSETVGSITIAYGAGSATTAAVGTYTGSVTPSSATGGTFTASNYTITYAAGNIIVNQAPLIITANNVSKAFGATLTGAPGSTAFAATGLQNSETVGSLTIAYGAGAAANAPVGAYNGSVIPSAATGGTFTATNYSISYVPGAIFVLSTNANLSNLRVSAGSLTPAFTTATTGYTDNVSNSVSSVTVTPTTSDANATIKVNGTAVTSGTASAAIPLAEGTMTAISVVITAQDGTTIKTYTISVSRAPSSNANLSAIGPGISPLVPSFSPATTSYALSTSNAIASVTVKPVTSDANATIKVNGTSVTSGTVSQPVALAEGAATQINIVVTAQDGTTIKTYTITVSRAPSADASLSNIKISNGTLSPVFSPATAGYSATVPNTTPSITVTPAVTDANATIQVNGVTVASGAASHAIGLAVGANNISIVVTAQNGSTTQTYTVTVTRIGASNANLTAIGPSITPLNPAFSSATTNYTISAANAVATITVKPVTADPNATITVNGTQVTSGTVSQPIALAAGATTAINIVVTAQDGTTAKTYTIGVTRAASAIATLSSISLSSGTLSPVFAPATISYTASVSNTTTSITLTPTTTDANATLTINGTTTQSGTASGPIPLAVGANKITTIVTAQNGTTTKTYIVTVTRAASANANLASINPSVTPLNPAFTPATTSYTLSVANSVSTMTVRPVTNDANATMKVNGTGLASGTTSTPIALAVGPNTVTIVVTAQNGTTTKTYTITVTRASGGADSYGPGISVTIPVEIPSIEDDVILVHQGVSPNGDGINDFLQIDNISRYPENKLTIMNRNGQLVYEAKGYDNTTKAFDGHSNKNGQMQLPGTYFYQLDYTVGGIAKHKTGFIVLKY